MHQFPPDTLAAVGLSPFIGSFAGVLIRRLPSSSPVMLARSRCESCGATLRPIDLVPLLSFVALRGRCAHCAAPIARFHLAVELAAMLVAAACALSGAQGALLWSGCALGWTLLVLAWIDWEQFVLPDTLDRKS